MSTNNTVYIKQGQVVNSDKAFTADVYIQDGIIKFIGPGSEFKVPQGTRIIDAKGKLVMPGGIDPHTHFEVLFQGEISPDDFYVGTKASVAGGTTTIIDFVLPKTGESLIEKYHYYRKVADEKVCCDYNLHICLSWWSKAVSDEIEVLARDHGVSSFKMFMAYKGFCQLRDWEMYEALERIRAVNSLAMVHAENGDIIERNVEQLLKNGVTGAEGHQLSRQEEVEAEAVNRACILAHQANCPLYVVHIMSRAAAHEIARARERYEGKGGIYAEALAAGIAMDGCNLKMSCHHIMSPPIRPDPSTPEFLLKALASDELQVIASDNCAFYTKQKERGKDDFSKVPTGINGAEDRMSVAWEKGVYSGIFDPCRFVALTSTNAAQIFNMYPKKGVIAVGSDADIVVWDPLKTRKISKDTHHHAIDYNVFEGMVCHGVPDYVLVRGKICVDKGKVDVERGFGKFVETPANNRYIYDQLQRKRPIEEPYCSQNNYNRFY